MSFICESKLPVQCCYCASPLFSDLDDDCVDACSSECAHKYALLALEGKVERPEYSPLANAPPSSFSPDSSDEELPELPEFPDNESMYRESIISTTARASATESFDITDCLANEELTPGPTRPATPTPDSANQHERIRNTRLLRAMYTATNRRADKVPRVHFEDKQERQSEFDGSAGAVRKVVSRMILMRSRSDARPVHPDSLQPNPAWHTEQ